MEVRREICPIGESEGVRRGAVGSPALMVEQVTSRGDTPRYLVYSFHTKFTGTNFRSLMRPHVADRVRITGTVLIPTKPRCW